MAKILVKTEKMFNLKPEYIRPCSYKMLNKILVNFRLFLIIKVTVGLIDFNVSGTCLRAAYSQCVIAMQFNCTFLLKIFDWQGKGMTYNKAAT